MKLLYYGFSQTLWLLYTIRLVFENEEEEEEEEIFHIFWFIYIILQHFM